MRKILAALGLVVALGLTGALGTAAGATDFGYEGNGDPYTTRFGDYGTGHNNWGENAHDLSFCFYETFPSGSKDPVRFGFNSIADDAPGLSFVEQSCQTHTDVVIFNVDLPGTETRRFTPTGNIFGATDGYWAQFDLAEMDAQSAAVQGFDCNGAEPGTGTYVWFRQWAGAQAAAVSLGVNVTFETDTLYAGGVTYCSWNAYILSTHHRAHVAGWNA